MKQLGIFSVITALLVTMSCNQPGIIGANIIPAEDNINVAFIDTITLKATTQEADTVKVYDTNPALQPNRYMTGRVDDPEFGIYASDIYTQFELLTTNPDFTGAVLDSIVLSLAYDNSGHYGDISQPFNLKVYKVSEFMDPGEDIYSNQTFATEMTTLADVIFTPTPNDSVFVDTTTTLRPHIRIPLDNALGLDFLNETDTTSFENDDFFTQFFFNGIKLEGNQMTNEGMIAFDLLDELTKIELHYTVDDTTHREFTLRVKSGSTKSMNFTHDYSSSPVSNFIDDVTKGDSLAFLQSMEGFDVKIEMPFINDIQNIIVNKAEFIVQVAQDANSVLYPIPSQLILLRKNSDGELILIEDVLISLQQTSSIVSLFGGQSEENSDSGETITEYRMNISGFLQDVIDGDLESSDFYITTYPKPDYPNRLILGGANHSQYKMKIDLTYTKLD